jgi:phenylalanine-4-hydroxylase
MGLTTGRAPLIEHARLAGDLFIQQPYELYSEENHRVWDELYSRIWPRWEQYATPQFLNGLTALNLDANCVPRLDDVNRFLCPRTGFRAHAVAGYIPAFRFFDCLRQRVFPTTITVRDALHLDYLPEPDIFHDLAGHVPMHADRAFADTLVRFGDCAHTASERVAAIAGRGERVAVLASIIRAMARFFWFTVEFGLMRTQTGVKACGSGLLSSYGEIEHAVLSPRVERRSLILDQVIHEPFEIDHFQPLLFVVDSFEHLYAEVDRLECWMREGKLDHVAPGEPAVSEADLASFLQDPLPVPAS